MGFAQRSFTGGEISPSLYARVDQTKYATGLRTCRNFLVMRHGGLANRPGSSWVGEVIDSTKTVRLVPFVFNSDQTYVLEFANTTMRVIRNGAYLTVASQSITSITNANPAVLTYAGADTYANGDQVYISGVLGPIGQYVNGRTFKVAGIDAALNTFQLNYLNGTAVNSTTWGNWDSAGTVAELYVIATPYLEADLQSLQFVQSADVITIVHPNYAPRELSRTGHTAWTLSTITFAPEQVAPTSVASTTGAAVANPVSWAVASISSSTGEESLAAGTDPTNGNAAAEPTAAAAARITWTNASGAGYYRVYRSRYFGRIPWGFIGISTSGTAGFQDDGVVPDYEDNPVDTAFGILNPFNATGDYPSTLAYHQGRLIYANTDNNPESVFATQVGRFKNFSVGRPIADDDAVFWTMTGNQVNEVLHLIEVGRLLVFTTAGEWSIQGNAAGIIVPGEINPTLHSLNGSSALRPLIVGSTVLYVQARGNIIRDFAFDFQADGYRGNDLTIFSAHLFDGYTIRDWAFQQIPQSIVWAVRSDGALLGLTYVREQEVFAWHRHNFQEGTVEQVCSVPEGLEDALYLVVKRTVNSATVRYIERLNTRNFSTITSAIFMDSALGYDGTNAGATTMTISGGTNWTYDELLTLTASASFFVAADVGNEIHITGSDGTVIRFHIDGYTGVTVVTGRAHKTVPAGMRSVARATWGKAVDELAGLWHLEAKAVSVFGDGFVVASPNNSSYTTVTVTNGKITLEKPYVIIKVGLPIVADVETLNIDVPQGDSLATKQKLITELATFVQSTRGIFAGARPPEDDSVDPLEGLFEAKLRGSENLNDSQVETYDDPPVLTTDVVQITLEGDWNNNGRVFIRQVDPLPLTILSIVPSGFVPYQGG